MLISEALTLQLAEEFDESIFVEFEDFVSEDKEHTLKQEDQDLRLKVRTTQQVLRDRGADPEDATWGEYPVGTLADTPYTGEDQKTSPKKSLGSGATPAPTTSRRRR
jgi:hypothetical protein